MSWTIELAACSTVPRLVRNPFTGESDIAEVAVGLTAAEREAVRALLASRARKLDVHGGFEVQFDGYTVIVRAPSLDGSMRCDRFSVEAHSARKISLPVAEFVYELAQRGNLVLVPEEAVRLVVSEMQLAVAQTLYGRIDGVVASAEELLTLLKDGASAWKTARKLRFDSGS